MFPLPAPAASGAALTLLTSCVCGVTGGAVPPPIHDAGTASLPTEPAPPEMAATECAPAPAPPPSAAPRPPRPPSAGGNSGWESPAQHSRALRNLNAEVAHTDAEVRQTLGVVEQGRVWRVIGYQGREVCGLRWSSRIGSSRATETALRWWWPPRWPPATQGCAASSALTRSAVAGSTGCCWRPTCRLPG